MTLEEKKSVDHRRNFYNFKFTFPNISRAKSVIMSIKYQFDLLVSTLYAAMNVMSQLIENKTVISYSSFFC